MYQASIENRGDTRYFATTRHSAFVLGTDGDGANPVDALLASLCGCLGHYVRDYLASRIGGAGFVIKAEAGIAPDTSRLGEIQVQVELREVALDDEARAELLGQLQHCKIHRVLKENPGVRIAVAGASGGCEIKGAAKEPPLL